ncbi:hypothetical protein K435DRAFT_972820 [Dendrothele bispora CBS 962.96]|uniref:Peptidase C14 caspase domain-containing protein n=1 Tax=Dendrothele bispora (strain CBS 962.96) TaxID=1314807 RepID=A0A4S8KWV5_DENBC|nr:hypothetical protein K435DRAFT_972820 [Dendrothele bispora CBS 962.96]
MFLSWLNVEPQSVTELLWYLQRHPPPFWPEPVQKEFQLDNPSPPPEITDVERPRPSLFALVIGVNKYKDPGIEDLNGAVPDADNVQKFLTSELHVPEDRIVNLRDEQATREAMVNAIQNLADNPAISAQDPILVFYAGHGGEANAPLGWQTSSGNKKIQMLIPHDFSKHGSKDYRGQGIFDITLSQLLTKIARNKSDNITVIFDSCHSGSGTRDDRDKTFAIRGVELPPNYIVPASVLEAQSDERATTIADKYTGLNSHVLLAACMQGQTAKERKGHGAFTSQLLSSLKEEGVDRVTYKDLVMRMPDLPDQNPQCEGANRTRILFNSKVSSPHRALFSIRAAGSKPGQYILEAGEAHGITKKTEFEVYSDRKMSTPIGTVVADETTPFNTRCSVFKSSPFTLFSPAYALQTHVGEEQDLRLFVEMNDDFISLFVRLGQEMHRTDVGKRSFLLLNNIDDEPNLALTVKDGIVQFHVIEQMCQQYGLICMPFDDIRADESEYLLSILRSAADFYWNLHHSNKSGKLLPFISFECLKLVESGRLTDDFGEILEPEENGCNLNVGGTIIVDVDEPVKYGFRINNNSKVPLYAALFYFDMSDLSVVPYYLPGTAAHGQVDVSLPANGSLTIGFGDGGAEAYDYYLRKNQKVDVGFLKLYLSTEYVDYSHICQDSPFDRKRASTVERPKKRELWDTLIIPVVQQQQGAASR